MTVSDPSLNLQWPGLLSLFSPSPGTSQVALAVTNPPASAEDTGDVCWIPGSGRFPGGGHGNPLQDSCLEHPWTEEPGRLPSIHKESDATEATWHAHTLPLPPTGEYAHLEGKALKQGQAIAVKSKHHHPIAKPPQEVSKPGRGQHSRPAEPAYPEPT